MENGILLDTDVFVDVSRGYERAVDFLAALEGEQVFVAAFTHAELLVGANSKREMEKVGQFLTAFNMLYPDATVSERAIEILKNYRLNFGIGIIDAFIAAMAIEYGLTLYSRNGKHFENVQGLAFRTPY